MPYRKKKMLPAISVSSWLNLVLPYSCKQKFWTDFAISSGFLLHGWFLTEWNVLIIEKLNVLCEYVLKVCMYIDKSISLDSSSASAEAYYLIP